MNDLNATLLEVTVRIAKRSRGLRHAYLEKVRRAGERGPRRFELACSNLAHGFAGCAQEDKRSLRETLRPNVGIVTAYNDMLSAHQPFESFPEQIRRAVRAAGGVAQVAGGVPAMCDGITQGQAGMELSLWSRDVIALATAVALSHDLFDGVVCLGVCDKIVPGLLIGALAFGHLPVVFMPAGPMPSGLSNAEKAKVRERFAAGEIGERELLEAEAASYHSPGTCTFYGTANSNQMLMEVMGLQLPGASFANPGTPLRDALTAAAGKRVTALTRLGDEYTPLAEVVDERAIANAIVGLLATGGSTNHTIHLVAIARAAGILLDWSDFDALSRVVPLLARVYPNGLADVNQFHAAGGLAFVIGELLDAGLLHPDVKTVAGGGLAPYRREVRLGRGGELVSAPPARAGRDPSVLRPVGDAFQPSGGLRVVEGNLGRAVVKTSAVAAKHRRVRAPALVFERPDDLKRSFDAGELEGDFVAVLRFQGPRANGMPELHQLMPWLGVLQDRGHRVALVTDGRLSGASGKVLSAIHVTPEAAAGGPLAKVVDGDFIVIDPERGVLAAEVEKPEWRKRPLARASLHAHREGMGREYFANFRLNATSAAEGAMTFGLSEIGVTVESQQEAPEDDEYAVLGW